MCDLKKKSGRKEMLNDGAVLGANMCKPEEA